MVGMLMLLQMCVLSMVDKISFQTFQEVRDDGDVISIL